MTKLEICPLHPWSPRENIIAWDGSVFQICSSCYKIKGDVWSCLVN